MKFRSSLDKYRRGNSAQSVQNVTTVTIESLTQQGDGVAHIDGQVVFIAHTAPGDVVKVRITEKHKRWLRASMIKLIKPSPQRCEPLCEYVPECGGCTWQHLKYQHQLDAKESQLVKTLEHVGGLEAIEVRPIVASAQPFSYRNRIRGVMKEGQFHFYANGSNNLVAIERCEIADERINHCLKQHSVNRAGKIELALQGNEVHCYAVSDQRTTELGFRQVNDFVSAQLTAAVSNVISQQLNNELTPNLSLLDLYCGHGSWSLQLGKAHTDLQVTGVDVLPENIRTAQRMAKGIKNISFITQSAERALMQKKAEPTFCIVDPPRAGLSVDVVNALNTHEVKTLVYVSCHPASLARDLAALKAGAYNIEFVQAFDMFPQTAHVETLAVLHAR